MVIKFSICDQEGIQSKILPVFRAPRDGQGCSAPVQGQGTLGTSPCKKKYMGRGHIPTHISMNIATTRLNRPSENHIWRAQLFQSFFSSYYRHCNLQTESAQGPIHLKCITRWESIDGVTITIFFQHTRDGHETTYLQEDTNIKI